jgi:hypothetical protein
MVFITKLGPQVSLSPVPYLVLTGHYEPQDELEEKRFKQRARGYAVVNGELYKSGVTEPWLRCITSEKGLELLKEIHSGFCGAHIGTRALAGKAIKQAFY